MIDLVKKGGVDLGRLRDHLAPSDLAFEQHFNLGQVFDGVHDPQETIRNIFAHQQPLLGFRQRPE